MNDAYWCPLLQDFDSEFWKLSGQRAHKLCSFCVAKARGHLNIANFTFKPSRFITILIILPEHFPNQPPSIRFQVLLCQIIFQLDILLLIPHQSLITDLLHDLFSINRFDFLFFILFLWVLPLNTLIPLIHLNTYQIIFLLYLFSDLPGLFFDPLFKLIFSIKLCGSLF